MKSSHHLFHEIFLSSVLRNPLIICFIKFSDNHLFHKTFLSSILKKLLIICFMKLFEILRIILKNDETSKIIKYFTVGDKSLRPPSIK